MTSLPPVHRDELLASSISMITTIQLKEPCIYHALVSRGGIPMEAAQANVHRAPASRADITR